MQPRGIGCGGHRGFEFHIAGKRIWGYGGKAKYKSRLSEIVF